MIAAALAAVTVLALAFGRGWRLQPARSERPRVDRWRRTSPRRRRGQPAAQHTIDALDALAGEVRSGVSLQLALQRTPAVVRAAIGAPDRDPDRDSERDPDRDSDSVQPHVAMAIHAVRAAVRLGGAQAVALDTAAALLRERQQLDLERRAQGAQALLSAKVMTVVPVAFTAWVLATNHAARAAAGTPFGVISLIAGALLNIAGWTWMRRIVGTAS